MMHFNNGLCIENTCFKHKDIHKKTWPLPDGTIHSETDYICISNNWRSSIQDIRVFRGAKLWK